MRVDELLLATSDRDGTLHPIAHLVYHSWAKPRKALRMARFPLRYECSWSSEAAGPARIDLACCVRPRVGYALVLVEFVASKLAEDDSPDDGRNNCGAYLGHWLRVHRRGRGCGRQRLDTTLLAPEPERICKGYRIISSVGVEVHASR